MAKVVYCGKWVSDNEGPDGLRRETCKLEPGHAGRCMGHLVGRPTTFIWSGLCPYCGGGERYADCERETDQCAGCHRTI